MFSFQISEHQIAEKKYDTLCQKTLSCFFFHSKFCTNGKDAASIVQYFIALKVLAPCTENGSGQNIVWSQCRWQWSECPGHRVPAGAASLEYSQFVFSS